MTFVIAASDAFFERLKNDVRAQRLYLALIDCDHFFARTFFEKSHGARGARFDYCDP
jgi:hypothetical protein